MNQIEVKGLCKSIKGAVVLDNINFSASGGKIYGFMGKNGSGKTMLLRTLAGLVKPSSGEIIIGGMTLHKDISFPLNMGIIIENVGLYPEFTGYQNLKFLSQIRNKIDDERIRASIEEVGLDPYDKRPIRKYSLGMRQRIVIAQALMESPDYILFDEPTNGLDENGIDMIRSILIKEAARNAIILIASHSKEDIDILCDEKYKMTSGRMEAF